MNNHYLSILNRLSRNQSNKLMKIATDANSLFTASRSNEDGKDVDDEPEDDEDVDDGSEENESKGKGVNNALKQMSILTSDE
ncbi:hypothetical protein RO3G_10067 [Rhizopus delemar RA 99-880]|uniref:Uncharacterized protein n=1 Tax=Rhizopus delemar (strain RA 99-880 / ATCC MYA-4621 / FGSC 9543 / NRRL 43880) TaxID=246409 RepID=I1CA77_RHIO9|nr:hypothetical protein RO3G_10067 [Rhizopus delemar RA 99-880]|eukprot:EIE85357.1 hypothetical protein RO3G_10067 [Rhizopus delemar RA 99-880]